MRKGELEDALALADLLNLPLVAPRHRWWRWPKTVWQSDTEGGGGARHGGGRGGRPSQRAVRAGAGGW